MQVPFKRNDILKALDPWRELDIRDRQGRRTRSYLHRFRQDGPERWLFVAQAFKVQDSRERHALHEKEDLSFHLKGRWNVFLYDAPTGEIRPLPARYKDEETILDYWLYGEDSLLLRLVPRGKKERLESIFVRRDWSGTDFTPIPGPVKYSLDEPNALLLDRFQFALDQGEFQETRELLRLDNIVRERLGFHLRSEFVAQPYTLKGPDIRDHELKLRVQFASETEKSGCLLALEEPQYVQGFFNGEEIPMEPVGFYVDRAISTVKLPKIRRGENELLLIIRFGDRSNLEWMYILGDFGVEVAGTEKRLVKKPSLLYWGDYTRQGFPFYTGNMTYKAEMTLHGELPWRIRIPQYAGAALKVSVNGDSAQMAAFLPYGARLERLREGRNRIEITCLGHRFNGFGQVHLAGDDVMWMGPDSWRTKGDSWTEGYVLRPMGVLTEPLLY